MVCFLFAKKTHQNVQNKLFFSLFRYFLRPKSNQKASAVEKSNPLLHTRRRRKKKLASTAVQAYALFIG